MIFDNTAEAAIISCGCRWFPPVDEKDFNKWQVTVIPKLVFTYLSIGTVTDDVTRFTDITSTPAMNFDSRHESAFTTAVGT